ncbi:(p)ppGpp synthetase [Gallibacterium anatis 7990]|nr:(p)ppGpp synthetase [Gallibacterium anatis 7990]
MTREEFLKKYELDKPMLEAWANFIIDQIKKKLPQDFLDECVKIHPVPRIKSNDSIIEKVFIRKKEKYTDPYNDVKDKVGIRWVVLLTEQLEQLCNAIKNSEYWDYSEDRTLTDWENQPYQFGYQSIHYVLSAKNNITYTGITIQSKTPCEVQLRTLLQHTYSEFDHDTIYKGNSTSSPEILRQLAKSMALLETTDELLCSAKNKILQENQKTKTYQLLELSEKIFKDKLNLSIKEIKDKRKNTDFVIFQISTFIEEHNNLSKENFSNFLKENDFIFNKIKEKQEQEIEFKQPIMPLLYYMVDKYRRNKSWHPFSERVMESIYADLGHSYDSD